MVENYQAAYLAKPPRDPAVDAQELSSQQLAGFELQRRLEYVDEFANGTELLKMAQVQLRGFSAIGTTEDLGGSLRKISHRLGCPEPRLIERQNVNPEPVRVADLSESTLAVINSITAVDQQLYEFACAQL